MEDVASASYLIKIISIPLYPVRDLLLYLNILSWFIKALHGLYISNPSKFHSVLHFCQSKYNLKYTFSRAPKANQTQPTTIYSKHANLKPRPHVVKTKRGRKVRQLEQDIPSIFRIKHKSDTLTNCKLRLSSWITPC